MSKILILDSGTQGYITVKSLKRGGHTVFLLYRGKHNYADDSKYVDFKFQIGEDYGDPDCLRVVMELVKKHSIDAVIPMSDASSLFLCRNKDVLQPLVRFFLPNIEVFEKGYDKNSLMALCAEKGYPHPQTINDVDDINQLEMSSLSFPMLIKPNHTCGGRGMTLVHNGEELKSKYPVIRKEYGACHLQKYIRQGGAQVEVQIYINEQKELVASSVIYKYRWYPENGGSSCCATAIENNDVVQMCYNLLKDIGWVGFADFDLIEDPDEGNLKVMELNPRVPACVKAAVVAGVDWPNIIVNEYLKQPQKQIVFNQGKILKHLGMEALWFYYSKNRFKTRPSLFKVFGRNIYYQDLDFSDLLPFIKGTLHNIKQQMNPEFRKQKSGTRHS